MLKMKLNCFQKSLKMKNYARGKKEDHIQKLAVDIVVAIAKEV